jgi:hypothetical protein
MQNPGKYSYVEEKSATRNGERGKGDPGNSAMRNAYRAMRRMVRRGRGDKGGKGDPGNSAMRNAYRAMRGMVRRGRGDKGGKGGKGTTW